MLSSAPTTTMPPAISGADTRPSPGTVFVTSATGLVGTTLCAALLSLGYRVHAISRDLSTPSATSLLAMGVNLTQGDWDDEPGPHSGLETALEGCNQLFLCILPDIFDKEVLPRRGARVVKAAKERGVTQVVVLTSLGSAVLERGYDLHPTGFARGVFQGWVTIEDLVQKTGFQSWTLLRPGFFMANFLEPKVRWGFVGSVWETGEGKGVWKTSMYPDWPLGLVDHVDIARFIVAAFNDPKGWHGRTVGLASDEMPVQESLDILADAVGDGRKLRAEFRTDEEIAEALANGEWMFFSTERCVSYMTKDTNDLEELRAMIPEGLTSWREFLEREKDAVQATYRPVK